MSEDTGISQEVPLDPGAWTEPEEKFIARLAECRRSTTDESHGKDGRTFTEARQLPRPLQQFRVVWERLDAVWENADGTVSPVKVYMTLDLEKFVDGRVISMALSKGNNKATYTLEMWKKAGVRLAPDPTVNEGCIFEVTRLRSKLFGTVSAKDITYPIQKFPEGYVYKGDIRRIQSQATSLDDAAAGVEATVQTSSQAASFDEDELAALLAGVPAEDTAALTAFVGTHKEIPADMRLALIDGAPQKALIEAGKLAVIDGVYAVPVAV